jgi:hypothetical protein
MPETRPAPRTTEKEILPSWSAAFSLRKELSGKNRMEKGTSLIRRASLCEVRRVALARQRRQGNNSDGSSYYLNKVAGVPL